MCDSEVRGSPRFCFDQIVTTGAVYLAGYGIECILKSLILSVVAPGPERVSVLQLLSRCIVPTTTNG